MQIRRASASVPANIAEGNGRRTRPDYLRHLSIANGSLLELESHLLLAERLRIVDAARLARAADLSGHVGRMLHGLIRSLTRADLPDSRPHPTPGAHPAPTAVSASPAPPLPLPPDPAP